ncbi:integrase core domain protein, partial [Lasius niger]
SRRQCESFGCEYCARIERKSTEEAEKAVARLVLEEENLEEWRKGQREDPSVSIILRGKEMGVRPGHSEIAAQDVSAQIYWSYWDALTVQDGILYKRWEAPNLKFSFLQLVVPQKRVKEILEEVHDSPSGGHFGVNKTLEKIRKRFYWATCKQDVEDWCRSCKVCVARKGPAGKGKSPLQIYNVGAPFERVQMDILGPLPTTTSGNKYLLVIVDCFTKWVEAFPLKNIRTKMVAEVFVNQFISRHGVPTEVHTDQGKSFESKLFAELSELLGIRKTRTTALHPQSDGQVERQHQTIISYLAKYISENQKDWDRWIPMFLLAYRSSKHENTGVTPAELYFARDLRLPVDLLRGSLPKFEEEESPLVGSFVKKLREKLKDIHSSVRERMKVKSSRVKAWYDRKARQILFQEGQKVWFYNPRRVKGKAPKLQSNWEGPFQVVKKFSDVVYCIQKTPKHRKKVVHADRMKLLFRQRTTQENYLFF